MKGNLESLYSALQSEHLLLSLLDAASQAILITDHTGKIILANERVAEVFGYDADELIECSIENLLPETMRQMHRRHFKKYLDHPYIRSMGHGMNLHARHKDGTLFPVEIGLSHIQTEEGMLVMALVTDISQRRSLDEAILKNERLRGELDKERELRRVKSAFVTMVTHDFRNPLNVIRLEADLLQHKYEQLSPEKREKHFVNLRESIDRINHMIDQMMAMGKVDTGQMPFEPNFDDLQAFCEKLVETLRMVMETSYQIEFYYEVERPTQIFDRNLLHHILTNLLSNAAKYSPEGGTIQLEVIEDENFLIFNVRDHGIGIPSDELEHLFEPFSRAGNVGKIPGTGLGLSIAKGYTELHGGTITCHSRENIGSTFTVRIPKPHLPPAD